VDRPDALAHRGIKRVPMMKVRNVKRGESIFRIVLGVALIVLAFLVSRLAGIVLGLGGVALILTAFFGY
jgi:predicted phage tail protein